MVGATRPRGRPAVALHPGMRGSTQVVHDDLRARILTGELPAGSELAQSRVAADYGVSRGPVREAFRMLEREGLLAAQVNQRCHVMPISLTDVEHVYALRVANESLALTVSVPRMTPEELATMEDLLPALSDPRSQDFDTWESRHQRFHALLVHHVEPPMRQVLAQWADHTSRYRRVYLADETGGWSQGAREHAQLLEHCRNADVPAAGRLLAQHLSRAAVTLLASMDPGYEPALLRAAVRQVVAAADAAAQQGEDRPTRRRLPAAGA
ncbi:GntR family transcriptional regulator [Kineosporia sp. A_224]|uniref:GntR family transcriptional regulator n=1 Tax=Kineosporia sp. A_224 TaxID=1962180 RepID=UPI000B4B010E|nr:GntR family transcriptional regulator [Kineosporia sp. A_224]